MPPLSRAEKRRLKKQAKKGNETAESAPIEADPKKRKTEDAVDNDNHQENDKKKKKRTRRAKPPKKKIKRNTTAIHPSPITTMDAIVQGHISVTPAWLKPTDVERIRRDAEALRAAGAFTTSAIGGQSGETQKIKLRKRHSECCGLFDDAVAAEGVGDEEARNALMDAISDLREVLSRKVTPLAEFMELQYLYYPGDGKGFYGKHIDQQHRVPGKVNRVVSMVLYLNDLEWDYTVDGGNLRAYPPKSPPEDINPRGGTLVLFDSGKLLHEAMPTQRDRWALVGWFMAAE
ncbi:hypothetical protein LEN26_013850 [Aphanomyces euteiches]|nr:hypothetical protein LEN26_013850 [Aphanomyces euteiches]KAH9111625.1 hypothetical protein AeMF1_013887 [Aphanomyces euteiches]KAH9194928.1 hypothetical protein AeNC1_003102 [Aphanomyces euteiches]